MATYAVSLEEADGRLTPAEYEAAELPRTGDTIEVDGRPCEVEDIGTGDEGEPIIRVRVLADSEE